MSLKRAALTIGWDKNGDTEFAVHLGELEHLSYEQMQKLRSIIPVAISELERYWREIGPPSRDMVATQAAVNE